MGRSPLVADCALQARLLRILASTGILLALGACTTATYSSETDALASAAQSFKAQTTAVSPVPAADATAAKAVLIDQLVQAAPHPLYQACDQAAATARNAIVNATTTADEDAAYETLRQIQLCGANATPAVAPLSDKTDAVLTAINQYFDGLQAIVAAKDSSAVASASQALATSLTSLAVAANASAPAQAAPGFAAKLAGMVLAQAQYEALRQTVLDADPLFDAAAPGLVRALRLTQSLRASEVAQDASLGVAAINSALASSQATSQPTLRLQIYDRASPILEDLTQQLQATVQTDPADAVHALINAHHSLASALKSNRGQAQAILTAVMDIVSGAQALNEAGPAPAQPTKAGTPAHG